MKKVCMYFLAAAAIFCGSVMASCSKSNEDLIKDYRELCEDAATAVKNGDISKAESIAKKGEKLMKELDERELTDSEKQEVLEITAQFTKEIAGGAANMLGF